MIPTPALYTVQLGSVVFPSTGYHIEAGTLDITQSIGKRSKARFTTFDKLGLNHWLQNQRVIITDQNGNWIFSGFIDQPDETKPSKVFPTLLTDILCKDNHWLADKRRYAQSYANEAGDQIVMDVFNNVLVQEWIYVIKNMLTANQSSVETNLTGLNAWDGATMTRDTTQAQFGSASAKFVCDGSQAFQGLEIDMPFGSLITGQNYTWSAYVLAPLGANLQLKVQLSVTPFTAFVTTNFVGTGAWQRVSGSFVAPSLGANLQCFVFTPSSGTAVTFWCDGMQFEPNAVATGWEIGQTSSVAPAALVAQETFNYVQCSAILDKISADVNYWWAIDQYLRLWFQPYGALPAPYVFDGSQALFKNIDVQVGNPAYRNTQFITGGTDLTSLQTETRKGDGVIQAWPMRYAINQQPTVTINGGTWAGNVLAQSPVRFYRLGESSGTVATDSSTAAQNGTYVGSPTLGATGLVTGDANTAVGFNGSSQYVTVPLTGLPTGAQPWSLACLCKPTNATNAANGHLVTIGNPGTTASAGFIAQNAGGGWNVGTWGGATHDFTGNGASVAGHVYLVSATFDGTNLLLYVADLTNGDTAPTAYGPFTPVTPTLTEVTATIGRADSAGFYFNGVIDEAQIYTGILSAAQVARLYTEAVNGAVQTVGTKGSTGKNFYWLKGDPILSQDSAGTVLTPADTLAVTYIGQFPNITKTYNQAQITTEQMLEGVGTGIVEDVDNEPNITSSVLAFSQANALLQRYGTQGKQLTFLSYNLLVQPGQILTCNYAPHGLTAAQGFGAALIESVEITDQFDNLNLTAKVIAVIGPYDVNWVNFFLSLIAGALNPNIPTTPGNVAVITTLLASLTMNWPAWSMSLTANSYVCPVPSNSLFPSTTLYPC